MTATTYEQREREALETLAMRVVRDHTAPPDHRAAARKRLVAPERTLDLSVLSDPELAAYEYLLRKLGLIPSTTCPLPPGPRDGCLCGMDHEAVAALLAEFAGQPDGSGDPAPTTNLNESAGTP